MLKSQQIMDLEVLLKRANLKYEKSQAKLVEIQGQNQQLQKALKKQLSQKQYKYLIQPDDPELLSNIEELIQQEISSLNKDLLQITLIKYCTGYKVIQSSSKASGFINAMKDQFCITKDSNVSQSERGVAAVNFCNVLESIYQGKCEVLQDQETVEFILDKYNSDSTIQQQQFGVIARQRILEGYKNARSKYLICQVELEKEKQKVKIITEKLQKGFEQDCQELLEQNNLLTDINQELQIEIQQLKDVSPIILNHEIQENSVQQQQYNDILQKYNCSNLEQFQQFVDKILISDQKCENCVKIENAVMSIFNTTDFQQVMDDRIQFQEQIINLNKINIEQNDQIQMLYEEKEKDLETSLQFDELRQFLLELFKIQQIDEITQFNSNELITIIDNQFSEIMKEFDTQTVKQLQVKIQKTKKQIKQSLQTVEQIQSTYEETNDKYQEVMSYLTKIFKKEFQLADLQVLSDRLQNQDQSITNYQNEIQQFILEYDNIQNQINEITQQSIQQQIEQHSLEQKISNQNIHFIESQQHLQQKIDQTEVQNIKYSEKLNFILLRLNQIINVEKDSPIDLDETIELTIQNLTVLEAQQLQYKKILSQLGSEPQQISQKLTKLRLDHGYQGLDQIISGIAKSEKAGIYTNEINSVCAEIKTLKTYIKKVQKMTKEHKLSFNGIDFYNELPKPLFQTIFKKVNEYTQLSFEEIIQVVEESQLVGINAVYLGLILRRVFERCYK